MASIKLPYDDEDKEERITKAKRHDLEPPMAAVDIKLAEKLDNILKLGGTRKPKFFTNKLQTARTSNLENSPIEKHSTKDTCITNNHKIEPRNLSPDELKERLLKKYDTLVPELDPKRPKVRLIKILSASESIELAKSQARKQMEQQMELNSVAGNQQAYISGTGSFIFRDGYEMPVKSLESPGNLRKSNFISKTKLKTTESATKSSKSVKFANDPAQSSQSINNYHEKDISSDDSTESDYTTGNEDIDNDDD